ncbi:uncharacterized protein LOC144150096 [Haemaphysalis longicornis]
MSRTEYDWPVMQRDPELGRHDLPRFTEDSQGNLVVEPLNTEDLPDGPPPNARPIFYRLAASVIGALLLALLTLIGVAFILVQSRAPFDTTTDPPHDARPPRYE